MVVAGTVNLTNLALDRGPVVEAESSDMTIADRSKSGVTKLIEAFILIVM